VILKETGWVADRFPRKEEGTLVAKVIVDGKTGQMQFAYWSCEES